MADAQHVDDPLLAERGVQLRHGIESTKPGQAPGSARGLGRPIVGALEVLFSARSLAIGRAIPSESPITLECAVIVNVLGRDATTIEALYADRLIHDPYLLSAVEMACWDALGKLCGQPLYRLLGGLYREQVSVACCMGIRPPSEA